MDDRRVALIRHINGIGYKPILAEDPEKLLLAYYTRDYEYVDINHDEQYAVVSYVQLPNEDNDQPFVSEYWAQLGLIWRPSLLGDHDK